MPRDVGVVVVAAGRGERMGGAAPKQFTLLAGVPLLLRALRPFLSHPDVLEVVAVVPPDAVASPPDWLRDGLGERLRLVAGGAHRMDSVEAGLHALGAGCSVVLVHDGARPFPDAGVIGAVIATARSGTGAIAAIPLSDTVKESGPPDGSGPARILRTVPRTALWRAQTPQGFPRPMLEAGYAAARRGGVTGTDEAALVELTGAPIVLVPDVSTNIKLTTPADLRLAEALAASGS